MVIFLGLVACAVLLLAVVGVRLWQRKRALYLRQNPAECSRCVHWDHDAGQRQLLSVPNFDTVMRVLTPNEQFGKKVFAERVVADADGNETTQRYVERFLPVYPPFENRWEYFGGCRADGKVCHRTDTCPKFERRVTR